MATINISVPHKLEQKEAVKRIKTLLKEVKREYKDKVSDVKEVWKGEGGEFSFKAMGFAIAGTLEVKEKNVELSGSLPFLASPFKGKIEALIKEKAKEILK